MKLIIAIIAVLWIASCTADTLNLPHDQGEGRNVTDVTSGR